MPISRKEFEAGEVLSTLEKKIISFLDSHRDEAFEVNEIRKGVNFRVDFSSFGMAVLSTISIVGFVTTIDDLARRGKIEKKIIEGKPYYTAK